MGREFAELREKMQNAGSPEERDRIRREFFESHKELAERFRQFAAQGGPRGGGAGGGGFGGGMMGRGPGMPGGMGRGPFGGAGAGAGGSGAGIQMTSGSDAAQVEILRAIREIRDDVKALRGEVDELRTDVERLKGSRGSSRSDRAEADLVLEIELANDAP